jgi:hypothetical protein
MNKDKITEINNLLKLKKVQEAELELSKLGSKFFKDVDYLYLRSKIFLINKLYYLALDTLLIATEFEQNDKVYSLIAEIYYILGNKELSKKIGNIDSRLKAISSLKKELTGISQKN